MSLIYINLVYEDELSKTVMLKILSSFQNKYSVNFFYHEKGFGSIKRKILGFNKAAKVIPFFVLTDLDRAQCPTELLNQWKITSVNPNMIFRIAVKEVEAWLLADIEGFISFSKVPKKFKFTDSESIEDPKQEIMKILRRSENRDLKKDILPVTINASQGPNYNQRLSEFVNEHWCIERAVGRNKSLKRTYEKLRDFSIV